MSEIVRRLIAVPAVLVALTAALMPAPRRDERGVVSIEYLVLGAAIIFMIGILGTSTEVQDAVKNAFVSLFSR